MGIRGLAFYLKERCPEACRQVSIEELAEKHRKQFGGQPCLVVDGMSIIRKVYGDLEWLFGGQWRMYVIQMQQFVNAFREKGIELIFVFDGAIVKSKRDEWVKRRLRGVKDTETVFSYIKASHRIPDNSLGMIPPGLGSMTRFILKFMCGCVTYTTTLEADQEVAEFARNNRNCFGILSQDSDFIVYDTKDYLSAEQLDLQTLTTVLYDRDVLSKHLNLPLSKFPLFSCLVGNDIISPIMLRSFHHRLYPRDEARLSPLTTIPVVANEIVRRGWTGNPDHVSEIRNIVSSVFGNDKHMSLFREALQGYKLSSSRNAGRGEYIARVPVSSTRVAVPYSIMAKAYERHTRCENMSFILALLANQECEGGDSLEDGKDRDLPAADDLTRPIRQRIYYVLFGHLVPCKVVRLKSENGRTSTGNIPDIKVAEWFATPHNPLNSADMVEPLPLSHQDEIPSLDFLWSDDQSEAALSRRLQLFLDIVGVRIPIATLWSIPPQFILPCCYLNYLLQPGATYLSAYELAAFIAQMVSPVNKNVYYLERTFQVTYVEPRAVHLATIFMRGVVTLMLALCLCGHPIPLDQVMPWLFFDGKLFHVLYCMAKEGAPVQELCCNDEGSVKEFQKLWRIATMNTSFSRYAF